MFAQEHGVPSQSGESMRWTTSFSSKLKLLYSPIQRRWWWVRSTEWVPGEIWMNYLLYNYGFAFRAQTRHVSGYLLNWFHFVAMQDTRYVSLDELRNMMRPESGLMWSPWFRIIAEHFLERWWNDLDTTILTDKHVDLSTIHKLDKHTCNALWRLKLSGTVWTVQPANETKWRETKVSS